MPTYSYTGALQNYTVPAGVTEVFVRIKGARGGTNRSGTKAGGAGATLEGILAVTPGEVLGVEAGRTGTGAEQSTTIGWPDGGGLVGGNQTSANGGGGGGRSSIKRGATFVAIAGGGGGGGGGPDSSQGGNIALAHGGNGGNGGGSDGFGGDDSYQAGSFNEGQGGGPGTQSAGGAGGGGLGASGGSLQGGSGAHDFSWLGGGGGGGGYYGGGGGADGSSHSLQYSGGGGGGGGSSLIPSGLSHTAYNFADGSVMISPVRHASASGTNSNAGSEANAHKPWTRNFLSWYNQGGDGPNNSRFSPETLWVPAVADISGARKTQGAAINDHLLWPGRSAATTTTAASAYGQDRGWNIPEAEMRQLVLTPVSRRIAAQTWTIRLGFNYTSADVTAANLFKVYIHKRQIPTVIESVTGREDPLITEQDTPTFAASPWAGFGNAMTFVGTNRDLLSQGIDAGTTARTPAVSGTGSAAAFTLEAKFRHTNLTSTQVIAGRYGGASANKAQPVLFTNGTTDKLAVTFFDNAGVARTITGTTTLAINTNYTGAATYDGTTLRLFLNGALEGSLAVSGVQASDSTTRFMIGRDDEAINGGYPFAGVIDEVRWSNAARYTAAYTVATTPFTSDANTLGLWHLDAYQKLVLTSIATSNSGTHAATGASANQITSWTMSVPEIVLEPGETLHVELWARFRGVTVGNQDIQIIQGNFNTVGADQDNGIFPATASAVKDIYTRELSGTSVGVPILSRSITGARLFSTVMAGIVTASRLPRLTTTAIMTGLAMMERFLNAKRSTTTTMVGVPALQRLTSRARTVTMVGVATFSRRITAARTFQATLTGIAILARRIIGARSFNTVMTGVATFSRRVTAVRAFSVVMAGVATFVRRITGARAFTATMSGIGAMRRLTSTARLATMTGIASFTRRIIGARSFTTTMTGVATFARRIIGARSFTTTMVGVATYGKLIGKRVTQTMVGVATFARRITGARSFQADVVGVAALARLLTKRVTVTMVGVATALPKLIFGRHFIALMQAVNRMKVEMPQSVLNRITGGGGSTVIRKIKVFLFDD